MLLRVKYLSRRHGWYVRAASYVVADRRALKYTNRQTPMLRRRWSFFFFFWLKNIFRKIWCPTKLRRFTKIMTRQTFRWNDKILRFSEHTHHKKKKKSFTSLQKFMRAWQWPSFLSSLQKLTRRQFVASKKKMLHTDSGDWAPENIYCNVGPKIYTCYFWKKSATLRNKNNVTSCFLFCWHTCKSHWKFLRSVDTSGPVSFSPTMIVI